MIWVGLDDTDVAGSPGTNQLARAIVRALPQTWRCARIVRHQLFIDDRVPYTSKNGSASIWLDPQEQIDIAFLIAQCKRVVLEWYVDGSDPGLCVAEHVSDAVKDYGLQCQYQLMTQEQATALAQQEQIALAGLGGTNDGLIGAFAAVGLAASRNDGRVIQLGDWPDDLRGVQSVESIAQRNVQVLQHGDRSPVVKGRIDLGKKLRPNLRNGCNVLFVQPRRTPQSDYQALKLP